MLIFPQEASFGPLLTIYFLGGATRQPDALQELLLFAERFPRLLVRTNSQQQGVLSRTSRAPPKMS